MLPFVVGSYRLFLLHFSEAFTRWRNAKWRLTSRGLTETNLCRVCLRRLRLLRLRLLRVSLLRLRLRRLRLLRLRLLRLSRGLCGSRTRPRPSTRPARARCRLSEKTPRKTRLFCFFFSPHITFDSLPIPLGMVLLVRPRRPTSSRISTRVAASAPMGLRFPASSRGSCGSRWCRSRRQRPSR